MANDFRRKDRHVVPNFRSFADTVMLGDLDSAGTTVPEAVPIDFGLHATEWSAGPSTGLAGDIVSAALVSSQSDHPVIDRATRFILAHRGVCSSSLVSAARKVRHRDAPTGEPAVELPRLTTFLERNSRQHAYRTIHVLKNAITRFGGDPILFAELARWYMVVGNEERARRNIAIALSLSPSNRYVLRSAVRLYAHFDDADRAFHLLHKHPLSRHDPWVASARLAMAGVIGKSHMVIKDCSRMLSSGRFSAFGLTELHAGVGSVELLAGDRRRSRRRFQAALQDPNDNSLAQVEWGLSEERLFDVDLKSYKVVRNFEALALEAFNQCRWTSVLDHCEDWLMDQPFANGPAMMASHVASVVLEDLGAAKLFCQASRLACPDDPQVANNYAYALALDDDPEEALRVLDKHRLTGVEDPRTRVCLSATRGLACFRGGRIEEGRAWYQSAMEAADEVGDRNYLQMAALNYAREELLAGQALPAVFAEEIRDLRVEQRAATTQVLKEKVVALLDARLAGSDGSSGGGLE